MNLRKCFCRSATAASLTFRCACSASFVWPSELQQSVPSLWPFPPLTPGEKKKGRQKVKKISEMFCLILLFFIFNWWWPQVLPVAFGKSLCWRCYLSLYSHDCLELSAHWTSSAKVCWLYHRALASPHLHISGDKYILGVKCGKARKKQFWPNHYYYWYILIHFHFFSPSWLS